METTLSAPRRSPWGWAFIGIVGGAVLLLVLGLVAMALVANREQTTNFKPHSPQWTVQRYLNLLQEGKVDRAYDMSNVSYGPGGYVTRAEFHSMYDSWNERSHRVTLISTSTQKAEASVTVRISTFSAGPFGSSTGSSTVTFTMVPAQSGGWQIDGPAYLPEN